MNFQVKDIIYNVRTEVKEIQSLKESVNKLRTELSRLKGGIKKFEENMKLLLETIITLKNYK